MKTKTKPKASAKVKIKTKAKIKAAVEAEVKPQPEPPPVDIRERTRQMLLDAGLPHFAQYSQKNLRKLHVQLGWEMRRRELTQVHMDKVTPQATNWLWPGRIAIGKINLIQGDSGVGKGRIALDIAARVSAGAQWPDGSGPAPLGRVFLLCPDDGVADTIQPRLVASGADLSRIRALSGVAPYVPGEDDEPKKRDLDEARPSDLRHCLYDRPDTKLVIIDPAPSFHAAGGNGVKARQWLKGIADLAAERGAAVLLVTPRNAPKPMLTIARTAWVIEQDPADENRRLMLPAKNNLTAGSTGLALRIENDAIAWEESAISVPLPACRLASRRSGPAPVCRNAATDWLTERLSAGPVPVRQMKEEVVEAGFSWGTILRAFQSMPTKSVFDPAVGGFVWRLREESEDPASSPRQRGMPRASRQTAPRPRQNVAIDRAGASNVGTPDTPLAPSRLVCAPAPLTRPPDSKIAKAQAATQAPAQPAQPPVSS